MARYISVSRRTDIPRFFYKEFFEAWKQGKITYDGGHGRSYTISLKQDDVVGYIFWSKDYSCFINHPEFHSLITHNNALFHYTLNNDTILEPHVATLKTRLQTMQKLCDLVGEQRVLWRYDPLCKYKNDNGETVTNLDGFFKILPLVEKAGISRCYFSFMTLYRALKKQSIAFEEFYDHEKFSITQALARACIDAGITLYNCCNPETWGMNAGVLQAHCIDDGILRETDRFGIHETLKPKPTRTNCGCYESRDIGSYLQKCHHRCRYCYAGHQSF